MKNDFLPTASIEVLRKRAEILQRLRKFFDDLNFFEVETPLLSHDIVVDRYIHPVGISKQCVTNRDVDAERRLWLQTSPEFGMKRIMAAGAPAIYQICKAFRQGEAGNRHNPEFTMLEWYRAGDDLQTGMELLAELVEAILEKPKTELVTYQDAFKEHAGIDPFEASIDQMQESLTDNDVQWAESDSGNNNRDDWLNMLLSEVVEPRLGTGCPTIIYDWPASQSALSVVRPGEPDVAERFEIYVDGCELANGYHELLDPDELSKRNSLNNQLRVKDGSPILPEGGRLLEAMRHGLPECAGVALGVDRLVMLATGAVAIKDVIAFPMDRA